MKNMHWNKKRIKELLRNFLSLTKKHIKSFTSRKKFFSFFIVAFFAIVFLIVFFLIDSDRKNNGTRETAIFLNSIKKSNKLTVWSNKQELCPLLEGKCHFGESIPEYTEFDYFVFFLNQGKNSIENNQPFSALKELAGKNIDVKRINGEIVTKAKVIDVKNIPPELLPPSTEFSFAIIGDSQKWGLDNENNFEFYSILENIKKFNPDFLLAMGDITRDYFCESIEQCRPHFERWRDEVKKYVPIVYPAFGNHDEGNKMRPVWSEIFSLPSNGSQATPTTSFSFDYKNSHFTFIDSEKAFQQQEGTEQAEWLKRDLENSHKRNLFVISHATDFNKETMRQAHKWKTLLDNDVFAQFSGHTHVFCYRKANGYEFGSTGNNINIFTVGNSGSMSHPYPPDCESQYKYPHFAIVKIKGSSMSFSAYKSNGEEITTINTINESYFHQ